MSFLVAFLAGSVVLQVPEGSGLSTGDLDQLISELRGALEAEGQAVTVDGGPSCEDQDDCLRALTERAGVTEAWSVRVFEAVTVVRVVVKRAGAEPARFDLSAARSEWRAQLGKMVRTIVSSTAPKVVAAEAPDTEPPEPEPSSHLSLVVAAGGGATLVAGALLVGMAHASYADLSNQLSVKDGAGRIVGVSYSEALDRRDSAATQSSLGMVLVGVGLAAASVGVGLLLQP